MKKLYSISELINENISLKKKLEKIEKENIKNIISMLVLIRDTPKGFDLNKIIDCYRMELNKLL